MFLNGFSQKDKNNNKIERGNKEEYLSCLSYTFILLYKQVPWKGFEINGSSLSEAWQIKWKKKKHPFFFFDFLFTWVWQTKMVSSVCGGGGGCVLRSFINAQDRVMMMVERGTVAQYLRPCPPYSRTLPGPKRTGWLATGKLALAIEVSDTQISYVDEALTFIAS